MLRFKREYGIQSIKVSEKLSYFEAKNKYDTLYPNNILTFKSFANIIKSKTNGSNTNNQNENVPKPTNTHTSQNNIEYQNETLTNTNTNETIQN